MAGEVEPAKKILLPYLQRADELQKHEPLVAYYCRLYAMERGLKIPVKERTKTTNAILISLMNQLEKDKKSVKLGPEDNLYVEGFALNVFAKADKQDRAGRADLNTAKTFYAASIFFEILHQFGEVQPDMEQRQKYAVWKAADIRKALSEGRKPQPGPPGGDEELSISSGGVWDNTEMSPEKGSAKMPEEKPPTEQATNTEIWMPRPSVDGPEKVTYQQPSQPTYHQHDSNDIELPSTPQQPPDPSLPGYTLPYSGPYNASSSMPDASGVSPSMAAYQYGSRPQIDGPNGQSYHTNYNQYAPTSHDGQGGSNLPSVYSGHPAEHAGSDAVYYQSPSGHFPSAAAYPLNPTASFPSSSQYGSILSGESGSVRYSDPSGLERTTSAPASIKGATYQPPPERIADAHKASRFAVSALAFDDVPTALSFLKQALELLTNPAASLQ